MSVNAEFIERYQLEYEKNPQSKVFAPLCEAYRKMGLLDEAERISQRGVQFHPDFAGGRVAYAKVLLDRQKLPDALTQLEKATHLSPDNLLAHSLMGETLLQLRRPKEALKAFKMVLFLNPRDEKAKAAVRKWEFLTADEYEDEALTQTSDDGDDEETDRFEKLVLSVNEPSRFDDAQKHARALERVLSLADAFTVRSDVEAALRVLHDGRRLLGPVEEIENRLRLLSRRAQTPEQDSEALIEIPAEIQDEIQHYKALAAFEPLIDPGELTIEDRELKREKLETLLRRIENRRA